MNYYIVFILVNIINIMRIYAVNPFHNRFMVDRINLERVSFKYIIFKEKTLKKMLKTIKNTYEIYHNKSLISIAEGIMYYNELSEDEKTLIEAIISLGY